MSQLAQLSEAEIEARFHITGRRAVAFTLAAMARDGERFSLHFGDELFLTTLLAADPERVIREVQLFDVSVVSFPANPATVVGLRNDQPTEPVAEPRTMSLAFARALADQLR